MFFYIDLPNGDSPTRSATFIDSLAKSTHVTWLNCLKVVCFCPAQDKNEKKHTWFNYIVNGEEYSSLFTLQMFETRWRFQATKSIKSSPKLYVNKHQLTELIISIKSDKCKVFLPFQAIQAVVFSINEAKVHCKAHLAVWFEQRRGGQSSIYLRWLKAWVWLLISLRGIEESLLVVTVKLADVTSFSLSPNQTRFRRGLDPTLRSDGVTE